MATSDLGRTGIGGAKTDSDNSTISLSAVNDAPVNNLPASSTTTTDTPVVLTGVSVTDPDVGSALISVLLIVTDGTITLNTSVAGGVVASEVTGNGSTLLTIETTLSQLNATLGNGLTFTPAGSFVGTATLVLQTDDQGNSGAGGPRSDVDTQSIFVTGLVDHFTIDLPAATVAGSGSRSPSRPATRPARVATNYGGAINLTTSDGNATLPSTATFTAGVATFTATLRTAGPQTITATDAAVASITAGRSHGQRRGGRPPRLRAAADRHARRRSVRAHRPRRRSRRLRQRRDQQQQ